MAKEIFEQEEQVTLETVKTNYSDRIQRIVNNHNSLKNKNHSRVDYLNNVLLIPLLIDKQDKLYTKSLSIVERLFILGEVFNQLTDKQNKLITDYQTETDKYFKTFDWFSITYRSSALPELVKDVVKVFKDEVLELARQQLKANKVRAMSQEDLHDMKQAVKHCQPIIDFCVKEKKRTTTREYVDMVMAKIEKRVNKKHIQQSGIEMLTIKHS